MAIRVGQQSSGATAGIMAYAAGLSRARQQRQKSLMDMWRMGMGQRYRTAMEQQRWERRVGHEQKIHDRDVKDKLAEENRAAERQKEREKRGAALEQTIHDRGVKEKRASGFAQEALGLAKTRYNEQLARINEIRKQGASAWREPGEGKHKDFKKLAFALDNLRRILHKEGRGEDIPEAAKKGRAKKMMEYYRAAADEMAEFLSDYDASTHLIPPAERPGAVPTAVDIGGVPHIPTKGDVEFKAIPQRKPDPTPLDQYLEQAKKWKQVYDNYFHKPGTQPDNATDQKNAKELADRLSPITAKPGAAGGGGAGAPTGDVAEPKPGFMGMGGAGPLPAETPEENPQVQARAQAIIAELEEKIRADGPDAEAARIALEKMKPTTVPNPFGF